MDNLRDLTSRTLTSLCRNRDSCAHSGSPRDYRSGNEKACEPTKYESFCANPKLIQALEKPSMPVACTTCPRGMLTTAETFSPIVITYLVQEYSWHLKTSEIIKNQAQGT